MGGDYIQCKFSYNGKSIKDILFSKNQPLWCLTEHWHMFCLQSRDTYSVVIQQNYF